MGIVASILDASVEAASKQGAARITEIKISVGELTEIQEFALDFAFTAMTPGTMAEGAILTVNHIGASSRCVSCDVEFEHGRFEIVCPKCSGFLCELITGRELSIDSIEIDDAPLDAKPTDGDETNEDGSNADTASGAGE
ncbi:MAG: hydrogenase maturation nickel metallochaperone HypA [Coriobacteriia bacterium]|nr:hydrogenase maturation nickel metallochaperone HypA [Coriobacteriia bacterium]